MRRRIATVALVGAAMTICGGGSLPAQVRQSTMQRPWMNASLDAEGRVALLLPQMTRDEKLALVFGYFATDYPFKKYKAPEGARIGSAGYVPGIPRLGIPPQWETDAGMGVASQPAAPDKRERTALPSGLATAATWNTQLAFRAGSMIGEEARERERLDAELGTLRRIKEGLEAERRNLLRMLDRMEGYIDRVREADKGGQGTTLRETRSWDVADPGPDLRTPTGRTRILAMSETDGADDAPRRRA